MAYSLVKILWLEGSHKLERIKHDSYEGYEIGQ